METAVLIGAVLIAGLSCPAMMWWKHRRGRASDCCGPISQGSEVAAEREELERSRAALSARLAELRHDDA